MPQWRRRVAVGLLYPLCWAAFLSLWLVFIATGGVLVYREVFHFEAQDWSQWVALYGRFAAGATLSFDFVALGGGLLLLALLGCIGVTIRVPELVFRLGRSGPIATAIGLWTARPAPGMATGARKRSAARPRPADRPESRRRSVLRFLIRGQRRLAGLTRARAATADVPAVAMPPPANVTPAEDVALPMPETASHAATRTSGLIDADLAVFGRAMALFDVWVDPPADWIIDTLREELDSLSAAGWGLFAESGAAVLPCLEIALAHRLLPDDPAKRSAAQAALDSLRALAAPSGDGDSGDTDAGVPAAASTGGGLTPAAAWLCGLLDNYETLEGRRTAGEAAFEAAWGGVFQETCEALGRAMQTMGDADWSSLDRFPERAGRIRILTDRLRETFRNCHEPPSVAEALPAPRTGVDQPDDVLRRRLTAMGFTVVPLPSMGMAAPDLLARRGTLNVVLRLQPLAGHTWHVGEGWLSSWRPHGGLAQPSPCRTLWQRLALLRSVDKAVERPIGIVVLDGGSFHDEAGLAAEVKAGRGRTGVDLVWLEHDRQPLASLDHRLKELLPGQQDMGAG